MGVKKLVNKVINEIFRQMPITLTLDVPARPMDAKGLKGGCRNGHIKDKIFKIHFKVYEAPLNS